MDDVELWRGQEQQSCTQLLRKLACQIEGHSPEVGVPQQVVKVVGQQLKHQAQVVAEREVTLQFDCNKHTGYYSLPQSHH